MEDDNRHHDLEAFEKDWYEQEDEDSPLVASPLSGDSVQCIQLHSLSVRGEKKKKRKKVHTSMWLT